MPIILVTIFLSVVAVAKGAVELPCDKSIHRSAFSTRNLLHFAGIPELVDKRHVYEKFATDNNMKIEDVYKLFSFNGFMTCGQTATASITYADNVLTSAAHKFYNPDCTPKAPDFKKCYFQVILGKDQLSEPYYVESVEVGNKCPPYGTEDPNGWAVVKLKKKIPNANKLGINGNCSESTMMFASGALNFGDTNTPHYQYCHIADGSYVSTETTCDSGFGSSGGAFACRTGEKSFKLLGITNIGSSDPDLDHIGIVIGANTTQIVPRSDKFEQAIIRAANGK